MTKVKICGITNVEDARVAVQAGADAFGLIFAESPRRVTPEIAEKILSSLASPKCVSVGVFVNTDPRAVIELTRDLRLGCVQLSGGESAEDVKTIKSAEIPVVKSFRVSSEEDISRIADYEADAFLLDTFVPGKAGGTGKTFDWRLAQEARRYGRVILAGGLGVDNVAEAIRTASPYGVDACSRLERSPGLKDAERVREFIRIVKSVGSGVETGGTAWPK